MSVRSGPNGSELSPLKRGHPHLGDRVKLRWTRVDLPTVMSVIARLNAMRRELDELAGMAAISMRPPGLSRLRAQSVRRSRSQDGGERS